MFEEICLVCGKHLNDDGYVCELATDPGPNLFHSGAYCSEDCQNIDLSSPSISSSSSALSSPSMGYAIGGEVPPLMPSALGTALKSYAGQSGYYVSSSSASSTSWSVVTDEEDEDAAQQCGSEYSYHDAADPISDSKSANLIYAMHPSALSYARRPSGTNHSSTVPHLSRGQSGSSAKHVRGIPRSAPIHSHVPADEDDAYSDISFSSGDALDNDVDLHSDREWDEEKQATATKAKKTRNRASLPACFSLLQASSPAKSFRSSPVSVSVSSSGNTIARTSPPTPKVPYNGVVSRIETAVPGTMSSIHATPRGRRREADTSRSSRRSGRSSPSRSRPQRMAPAPADIHEHALQSKESIEQAFDWSTALLPHRGRATLRRNSSPLPKQMCVEDPHVAAVRRVITDNAEAAGRVVRGGSSSRPRGRGRARVEDLEGFGMSTDAPGYGNGRSGLVDRERDHHFQRVPL